jgi:hypothetical protein
MRSPATAVTFEAGKPWAQRDGLLDSGAPVYNFTVAIAAGMTVKVNLLSDNPGLHFKVTDQTHDKALVDTGTTGASSWTESVATATNYVVEVYVDQAATPPAQTRFVLQVGQYASANPQPAAATTAAAPSVPTM